MIRKQKWRYKYGRQITPYRIGKLKIKTPNRFKTKINYNKLSKKLLPTFKRKGIKHPYKKWKKFKLSDLFYIVTGDYHSLDKLESGKIPIVSCATSDNGIVGFFDIPEKYTHSNTLTITCDGTYAVTSRYHNYKFSTYDNVATLIPKKSIGKSTLLFIGAMVNIGRWRYSYGRKCYREKMENLCVFLPIDRKGNIDELIINKNIEFPS